MSIIATLPVFLLSNSIALNKLLEKDYIELVTDERETKKFWSTWVKVASHMRDSSRPGHVFTQRWGAYVDAQGVGLLSALACAGNEYLKVVNKCLYVREMKQFSRWQNIRSRMSTLPVKCYMQHRHGLPMIAQLAHPLSPSMADYIRREGLNETHLHLFACQPPEMSWLQDLQNIKSFYVGETKNQQRNQALYQGVNEQLTPARLANRMLLAKQIREELLTVFSGGEPQRSIARLRRVQREISELGDVVELYSEPEVVNIVDGAQLVEQERQLWGMLFEWCEAEKQYSRELEFFAHLYLLIENEYIHLRRQREERVGFDAFNEVESHKGVNRIKTQYLKDTMRQLLQITEAKEQNSIELRVSPQKFRRLGKKLASYWKDCCREAGILAPNLVLVVHFIKSDNPKSNIEDEVLLSDAYAELRAAYAADCSSVAKYAQNLNNNIGVPVGIDAAGDEMKVPPEVFALVYRQFERESHISHKTYHCGEDFYHLVGGIRSVYDAVLFLDLKHGNRVGHATAIGISPDIWKQDMPERLVQRSGDYLLDLIFAWHILTPVHLEVAVKLERQLIPLARRIFSGPVDMHSLQAFYDARHLSPVKVREYMACDNPPTWTNDPEEMLVIDFERKRGRCGLELLHQWHYDVVSRKEQEKLHEFELEYLDDPTLVYLQQQVQHLLNERNVVIETLPVSNLRISQYRDIRDHHLLRWLRVKGCGFEGDEKMTVCMGSDDPGIFVSDLKNEFYHVFANLLQAGLSPSECMEYIRQLNDAGRIYAFRLAAPEDERDEL